MAIRRRGPQPGGPLPAAIAVVTMLCSPSGRCTGSELPSPPLSLPSPGQQQLGPRPGQHDPSRCADREPDCCHLHAFSPSTGELLGGDPPRCSEGYTVALLDTPCAFPGYDHGDAPYPHVWGDYKAFECHLNTVFDRVTRPDGPMQAPLPVKWQIEAAAHNRFEVEYVIVYAAAGDGPRAAGATDCGHHYSVWEGVNSRYNFKNYPTLTIAGKRGNPQMAPTYHTTEEPLQFITSPAECERAAQRVLRRLMDSLGDPSRDYTWQESDLLINNDIISGRSDRWCHFHQHRMPPPRPEAAQIVPFNGALHFDDSAFSGETTGWYWRPHLCKRVTEMRADPDLIMSPPPSAGGDSAWVPVMVPPEPPVLGPKHDTCPPCYIDTGASAAGGQLQLSPDWETIWRAYSAMSSASPGAEATPQGGCCVSSISTAGHACGCEAGICWSLGTGGNPIAQNSGGCQTRVASTPVGAAPRGRGSQQPQQSQGLHNRSVGPPECVRECVFQRVGGPDGIPDRVSPEQCDSIAGCDTSSCDQPARAEIEAFITGGCQGGEHRQQQQQQQQPAANDPAGMLARMNNLVSQFLSEQAQLIAQLRWDWAAATSPGRRTARAIRGRPL